MKPHRFLLFFAATLFVACGNGSDEPGPDTSGDADVETDAAIEDAGDDVEPDVAEDVEADTEPDSAEDVVDDVPDVIEDPIIDAPDVEPDVPVDTGPDADPLLNPLPQELPFEYTRPEAGVAPTTEEIDAFTQTITGFWRDVDYFGWTRMHSHGVDASNTDGYPHYALWWQDVSAERSGDDVIFRHTGRADNLTLRTCKLLTNAIAGYLMTGDENMRWIVEEYSRGIAALAMGMEYEEDDPSPFIQARAIFTRNHEYDTLGGRHVIVDYDPVRRLEDAWNASIVHNPTNPYWGDIHVVNQRSKDDLPHMYRVVPMLMRAAADAPDESVREAAELALTYLRGFATDVIDSEYQIRTRYEAGEPVVPTREDGAVKDLASLVLFDALIPTAECGAELGTALVSNGYTQGHECGTGEGDPYEELATESHYFNYAIYRMFHVAALHNALMLGYDDLARDMMDGVVDRGERMMNDPDMPNRDNADWLPDVAAYLLTAAAAGMPLTGEEAQLIQEQYALSAAHYLEFDAWDPWAADFPQGPFDYKPPRDNAVRITEMAYLLEYCYSPFRNPAGVQVVDCDVIADMDRWGQ